MECNAAERKISAFLYHELDERDTEEFVEHVEKCESCMEELAIQYLISEGMHRLEEGDAFDMNKELREMLTQTKKRVRRRKLLDYILCGAEIAAVALTFFLSFFVLY